MSVEPHITPADLPVLKLDMDLLGLPLNIADLKTSMKEDGKPIHQFTAEDDAVIRKELGIADSCKNTFDEWYDCYLKIRRKYHLNIYPFGSFIRREQVLDCLSEVKKFNTNAREMLRKRVIPILERRYPCDIGSKQRSYIFRFNPRIRLGIYIVTQKQAEDDRFIRNMNETLRLNPYVKKKQKVWNPNMMFDKATEEKLRKLEDEFAALF